MTSIAADRGGSFGWNEAAARNWMRAAAPGIASRCRPAESSPIGSAAGACSQPAPRSPRGLRLVLIALLACAGVACFGNGLYILAKAELAQVLLHRA